MEGIAEDSCPEALSDDRFLDFMQHVTELRETKAGRYIRVHMASGAVFNAVPKGSLANGMEVVRDGRKRAGWRFVSPNIDQLWREWRSKKFTYELPSKRTMQ